MNDTPAVPPDDEPPSEEFRRALEEFERGSPTTARAAEATAGARVRGTVVSVGDEQTLIDIGGRSEGVVETRLLRDEQGTPRVGPGDPIDLYVVSAEDQIVLAPALRAEPRVALRQMREAREAGVPVQGRVTGVNSGGLTVDLSGARGFCPVSQIEAGFCADPSGYVGRTLEFLITQVDEARRSVVVSRRALLRRAQQEQAQQLLASLRPGDEREGTVARLEAFGAFVDLGGVDGLVHVSEIRHERLSHPRDALEPGQKVKVKVLRIEPGKGGPPRIALSIKAAAPDPWDEIEKRFPAGARVRGTVARLVDFGAFVALAPGIDGLVHISEIANRRIERVRDALAVGQEVEAVVISTDPARHRVALSIRRGLAEAPALEGPPEPTAEPPRPEARPAAPSEPTTMALALRAAMERAKKKQGG